MTPKIDPARLRQLREDQKLSQSQLAQRAKINKQTIYRLENGSGPSRKLTIERLSDALNVKVGVLTGELPIPPQVQGVGGARDDAKYQLKIRFDGQIRNAFSLAERRYNVPIPMIAELAPLLFIILAERSLQKRREKLEELENALLGIDKLASNFPHLTVEPVTATHPLKRMIEEERASILAKDIYAETMPGDLCSDWEPNPIAELVKELVASIGSEAIVEAISPYSAHYTICRDEALTIADGDEKIAEEILFGRILINQIPRRLMDESNTSERTAWLQRQIMILQAKGQPDLAEFPENELSELIQDEQDEVQS